MYTRQFCGRKNIVIIFLTILTEPESLTYKISTSVFNQIMACQHPYSIICHIISYNNKTLKGFISLI
jgi:hypothetical protein